MSSGDHRSQPEEERCAEARRLDEIDAAFKAGDLDALRRAVGDPSVVPNGVMPDAIGPCLVYAVYHSPIAFIRTLLEIGADPNAPDEDGFPPLIAALSCIRTVPGMTPRRDVEDVLRLLLSFGTDPNQRGINDYTPLHMAVEQHSPHAARILLEGGADPALRTRIDECVTPLEMARSAGLQHLVAVFEQHQRPLHTRLRSGLTLLEDIPGSGDPVRRQHRYRMRLRMWLNKGTPVRWETPAGPAGIGRLEDNGTTLVTEMRIDRHSLVNGLFYGIDGMRVGGTRRLEIAPHLAFGDRGVPGIVPANAVITAEVTILGPPA